MEVAERADAVKVDWESLYDKVIVRRHPAVEEKRGLAVADAYKKEQNVGTVLKVGAGRFVDGILLPLTLKPGHTVIFSAFAGIALSEDDPDTIVLREDEVLAYK